MKFGLFNLLQCPEGKNTSDIFKEELEQIQYAEEIGFHSAWIAEHHFSRYGLCGSPLLFAAAVAQSTKRIRLGLAVSVLPFGNLLHIAEEAAMVDVLSDGRLDFGVGRDTSNLELPVTVYTYIADSNQKARDQSEKHIMWHFGKLAQLATPQEGESISDQYKHYPKFFGRIAELDYDFIAENLAIIGDPDHCVERLKTAESEFGVNYVVFHMNFGGISPEHVMDSLRLFAKYVMPEFKDGTG